MSINVTVWRPFQVAMCGSPRRCNTSCTKASRTCVAPGREKGCTGAGKLTGLPGALAGARMEAPEPIGSTKLSPTACAIAMAHEMPEPVLGARTAFWAMTATGMRSNPWSEAGRPALDSLPPFLHCIPLRVIIGIFADTSPTHDRMSRAPRGVWPFWRPCRARKAP